VLALVITLTVAGGVLPIAAIGRAVYTAHHRYRDLDDDLRRIEEVMHSGGSFEEMETIRPTRLRMGLLGWARDVAERTLFQELRRPAILGAVGVLAGMAGSLLSLTL
jgi:hypothetical protein